MDRPLLRFTEFGMPRGGVPDVVPFCPQAADGIHPVYLWDEYLSPCRVIYYQSDGTTASVVCRAIILVGIDIDQHLPWDNEIHDYYFTVITPATPETADMLIDGVLLGWLSVTHLTGSVYHAAGWMPHDVHDVKPPLWKETL